jgi:hypothetical protein
MRNNKAVDTPIRHFHLLAYRDSIGDLAPPVSRVRLAILYKMAFGLFRGKQAPKHNNHRYHQAIFYSLSSWHVCATLLTAVCPTPSTPTDCAVRIRCCVAAPLQSQKPRTSKRASVFSCTKTSPGFVPTPLNLVCENIIQANRRLTLLTFKQRPLHSHCIGVD